VSRASLRVEVAEDTDPAVWQRNLLKYPDSTVSQTYAWARAYSEGLGDRPLFLQVRDGRDDVVAQLLMFKINYYERSDPSYNQLLRRVGSSLGIGGNLVWHYGPLVQDKFRTAETMNAILGAVNAILKASKATLAFGTSPPLGRVSDECLDAYRSSSYSVKEWGSFIIDVTRDEEVLWRSLNKKTRNDVRRAEKTMYVKDVTDGTLIAEFASLLVEYDEHRWNLAIDKERTVQYYRTFTRCMHESGGALLPAYKVILAYEGDKARAGLVLQCFNGNATQYSVISDGSQGNLGGPLLTWHAIRWAHSFGARTLDLVGVNPSPKDVKEQSIYFYKSKWGGEFRMHYHFIRNLRPFRSWLFARSTMLQRKLWNIQTRQSRPM